MPAIEAVIFDMDGTLVDSESVSLKAWRQTGRDLGVPFSDEFIHSLIGRNAVAVRSMVVDLLNGDVGLADKALRLRTEHFERISERELELMPGAVEALDALSSAGFPLAIATSTTGVRAKPRLDRFGLMGYFKSFTFGDEVSNGKPAPDIFILAAERLGRDARACAVVEDSFNGVRSGHAAGAQVFMVPDMVPPTEEIAAMCAAVLPSLRELPQAISPLC